MQGLFPSDCGFRLELAAAASSLTIDVGETTEEKIQRLVSENPVVIFSKSSCCMCHVMKSLLASVGAHPTVIELEEDEIPALSCSARGATVLGGTPTLFVGGDWVGGLESLMALHLTGQLVPKLAEAGGVRV